VFIECHTAANAHKTKKTLVYLVYSGPASFIVHSAYRIVINGYEQVVNTCYAGYKVVA